MPIEEGLPQLILALFDTFVQERRYLQNVAAKTLDWYACSRRAFQPYLADVHSEADLPVEVRKALMEMAASGKLAATSINDYARCMNAFLYTEVPALDKQEIADYLGDRRNRDGVLYWVRYARQGTFRRSKARCCRVVGAVTI